MGLLSVFVLPTWAVGRETRVSVRVKKIVVQRLRVDPTKVKESALFVDDLGASSGDILQLVIAFEREFGCEIPDDGAKIMLTVGDAIKFLQTCPRVKKPTKNGKSPCSADNPPAYCKTKGNR